MTIFVVSENRAVRTAFRAAERSRSYTVVYGSADELPSIAHRADSTPGSLLYIDAHGVDAASLRRRVRQLGASRPYRFGVLDPEGEVVDIAELFHLCAADYLGKAQLAAGVTTARLRRVFACAPVSRVPSSLPAVPAGSCAPSGSDWSGVRDGHEYTFLMLYAGLDRLSDLRRKSSESFLASMRRAFQQLLERSFAPFGARLWMWKEDDGLILMPFDGRSVDAVIAAIRFMLNRVLVNTEELREFDDLCWRLALHIGATTYRTSGRTGAIVSESVNFMFHLGSRYVEAGSFAVTAPVYALLTPALCACFEPRGAYESIEVHTLRRRVTGSVPPSDRVEVVP